jgi:uncharacterized membrane protein
MYDGSGAFFLKAKKGFARKAHIKAAKAFGFLICLIIALIPHIGYIKIKELI